MLDWWLPENIGTFGHQIDSMFHMIYWLTSVTFIGVAVCLIAFLFMYRHREGRRATYTHGNTTLEIIWTIIPALILVMLGIMSRSLWAEVKENMPPGDVMVRITARQFAWKFRYPGPDGKFDTDDDVEIPDELHVPVNKIVRVQMSSEDVIHSFFVPAFRIKRDVVPGRYVTAWFQATKPGTYHLFCAQYCGTEHAGMTGRVIVMEPTDYARWLQSGAAAPLTPVASGELLFERLGCSSCHTATNTGRGPSLVGVYGRPVKLTDGQTVVADENYLREHILTPGRKVVAGYPAIMPTFKGLISEEQLLELIAYLRSLRQEERVQGTP